MLYKILYKISTFKKIISFYKYQPPINSKPNTAIYDGQKLNLPFKKYYYYLPPLLACKPYKTLLYYEIPTSNFFVAKSATFQELQFFFQFLVDLSRKHPYFVLNFHRNWTKVRLFIRLLFPDLQLYLQDLTFTKYFLLQNAFKNGPKWK